MDATTLIPGPDPIPVPWGWFKFFLLLTFLAHILFMNVMAGSAVIALFKSAFRKSDADAAAEKDVSNKLTVIIALTVNLGVAPLLFLQVLYGHFFYVSSTLMAVYWVSVILLLLIAYYSAYYYKFKFDDLKTARSLLIGASVLFFLVIAFFFSNNMTLMLRPDKWQAYFSNPHGTLLNLSDPTLIPRYLHFMTASLAVGGLFMAAVWTLKQKKGVADAAVHIEAGMKWFTGATLAQIVIGPWFLMSLPRNVMVTFMGGVRSHTLILILGLAALALTLFFAIRRKVWLTVGALFLLTCLMVVMRDMVRTEYLKPYFHPSNLPVVQDYSPLILFLGCLVIGLGITAYVIRLALKTGRTPALSPSENAP